MVYGWKIATLRTRKPKKREGGGKGGGVQRLVREGLPSYQDTREIAREKKGTGNQKIKHLRGRAFRFGTGASTAFT